MKTLFFTILGFLSLNIYAQDSESIMPAFESTNGITFDETKNTLEIVGDVKYSDEIIQFANAKKVIFDRTTNEMLIDDAKKFSFSGKIIIADGKNLKGKIRYKLGEEIAYLY